MGLVRAGIALGVTLVLSAGCGRERGEAVRVVGSTSILPFAKMLAEEFNRNNPAIRVEVQGGGSTAGIQALADGAAEIASCSRTLKPEETGFTAVPIARDRIAIVVNLANKVNNLTLAQVRDIYEGKITNWHDVGGDDKAITLITREEGSGTREAFERLAMPEARIARSAVTCNSSDAVKARGKSDPGAIAYLSSALVRGELKAVAVDGVEVLNSKYPLVRPFLFVVKGTPSEATQKFIDFVLSPPAQSILEKEGLVRAK